jgi:hypothetical protein
MSRSLLLSVFLSPGSVKLGQGLFSVSRRIAPRPVAPGCPEETRTALRGAKWLIPEGSQKSCGLSTAGLGKELAIESLAAAQDIPPDLGPALSRDDPLKILGGAQGQHQGTPARL